MRISARISSLLLAFSAAFALSFASSSCQKAESPAVSATISGSYVWSSVFDGKSWSASDIDAVYVFNGKGYYYKLNYTGKAKLTIADGTISAPESDFTRSDKSLYSCTVADSKNYTFASLSGTYLIVNKGDDAITFSHTEGSVTKTYKLEKVKKYYTESGDPDDGKTRINHSVIEDGNDLVGLITDIRTDKGIPGVIVTDGYTCVKTDENGVYQFKSNSLTRLIYYSTPADYAISTSTSQPSVPEFYKAIKPTGSVIRTDFSLTPLAAKETSWTFVGIGDPQCATTSAANRYKSETIPDFQSALASYSNVYAMTLGDITFDSTNMWPTMKSSMASVTIGGKAVPFFQCLGNHDHDSTKPNTSDDAADDYNATSTFVSYYGPTDYSFDRGDVHVVVMDDIIVSDQKTSSKSNGMTWNYSGGFTDKQLEWLGQDIDLVENKESKMIFVCCHIQFRNSTANHYQDVLKLMDSFKEAHVMIGHTHYTQNYVYSNHSAKGGLPVYEHIHGAACGAWWTSSSSSTVSGEPNGYTIYEIEGAHIKDWVFKGTRKAKDFQLRVFNGNEVYYSAKSYPLNWYTASQKAGSSSIAITGNSVFKNCFVAQVFNDDDTYWSVALYKKSTGAKIGDFKRVANGASCNMASTAYYFNAKSKNSSSYCSKTASHYWYYKPASGDPAGETDWEVRATQKLPGGSAEHVYTCSKITVQADFEKEFYF